jgi:hypothetical protein
MGHAVWDISLAQLQRANPIRFADPADHTTRITRGEYFSRQVTGYYAAGTDHGAIANVDSRTKNRTAPHPHVAANFNWLAEFLLAAQGGIQRMRGGIDLHRRPKQCVVADPHLTDIEHDTIEIEENPIAEKDVLALVAEKRRQHPNRFSAATE